MRQVGMTFLSTFSACTHFSVQVWLLLNCFPQGPLFYSDVSLSFSSVIMERLKIRQRKPDELHKYLLQTTDAKTKQI